MLLQYFVNYNMKKGWYLTTSTHPHRQLEHARAQRKRVDGAIRWRRGKNHETWISTGEYQRSGLWQCRACSWSFALDRSGTICIAVSQVNQAAAEDDDGAKTEADGSGAIEVKSRVKIKSELEGYDDELDGKDGSCSCGHGNGFRIGPRIAAGAKREQQCVTLFPANNRLVCFQVPKPIDSLYFPCKK